MTAQEVESINGRSRIAYLDVTRDGLLPPSTILKRDGRIVAFDIERIENALTRCFASLNRKPQTSVPELARRVVNIIAAKSKAVAPTVEGVQDIVEMVLQAAGEFDAAKRYILYRAEHAQKRSERPIPEQVRLAFAESDQYFPSPLQKFQFFDKYSRFNYDLGRRETWIETVDRSVDFLYELAGTRLPAETYARIRRNILEMRSMPSMRLLAMAGAAARRNNVAIYNCSYQPVESIDSFVEALTISMSGCGVGFSVESRYVENFPRIKRQTGKQRDLMVVEDSAEGWANALRTGLETWFEGSDMRFDLSQLRPAGAALKIKGGRASGPEPLRVMLDFVRARVLARQGSFLRPIDGHDMMCAVGNAAVSGGVRRTAMISLFDYDDDEMRLSKNGDFERDNNQRWNANNSAVWPAGGRTQIEYMHQFLEMVESGRGEPGIFNRESALSMRPERRQAAEFGTNPCITGDTWVAVADGRGRARMADLVAEGRDVDVFSVKEGQLVIRTMRNPRKTGAHVPIYRVAFADGTYIRATANHRFVMRDGSEKTTAELMPNDALMAMTVFSYKKKGLPASAKCDYDAPASYRMLQLGDYRKSEHRQIYTHHSGVELQGIAYHIHHRDFDGRNNRITNLEYLSAEEHALEHRERMLGDNNPAARLMNDTWRQNLSAACTGAINGNAKDLSNEQLDQKLIQITKDLGRAALRSEYMRFAKAHDLPQVWQAYRKSYFGSDITLTLQRIAQDLDLPILEQWQIEARRVTDLPLAVLDGRTYVQRVCEHCGRPFLVRLSRREQAACGQECSQRLYYRLHGIEDRKARLNEAHDHRKITVRSHQVRIYNDLLMDFNRHPTKLEWQDRCRQVGISPEISRVSSPFRSWNELEAQAGATNHRVVSVALDGYEDVYTGTVDETHTFFSIGCERIDSRGRTEMAYVLSWQCGEILLRPWQFCNLSAAVARKEDTFESLRDKVEVAAIIGSIQSLATYFPGLRPQWKQNCDDERLLGVDITGQMDSPIAQDAEVKAQLRQIAVEVNRQTAAALGINQSAAITCVKPSGNSSQLLDCSSGLHTRWAPYYIRNVRVATHSPLYKVLRDASVPMDPENGQTPENANTWVIHFPVKAPAGSITRDDRSAIQQCEFWLQNKLHWTEHNPSCTIAYRPDEVLDVMKWVWEHRDQIGGMSFLPAFDAKYDNMPYVEITREEFEQRAAAFPEIDFSKVYRYEEEDLTNAAQELACSAGYCEIDI
jgi:ATP cone domain/HNH endonuclease